jgi:ABC-type transporter Mla maintaining outer membrane lipid asymmetry permease subunit MlaE
MGLSTRGGAIGLRRTTTRAVVTSFIMIIVIDFMLTRILLSSWAGMIVFDRGLLLISKRF